MNRRDRIILNNFPCPPVVDVGWSAARSVEEIEARYRARSAETPTSFRFHIVLDAIMALADKGAEAIVDPGVLNFLGAHGVVEIFGIKTSVTDAGLAIRDEVLSRPMRCA